MPMLVPGGGLPEASHLPCTSGGSIGATPSPIAKSAAFGDARRLTPTPASLNILLSSPIIAFCPLEFSRKFEPIYMLKVDGWPRRWFLFSLDGGMRREDTTAVPHRGVGGEGAPPSVFEGGDFGVECRREKRQVCSG